MTQDRSAPRRGRVGPALTRVAEDLGDSWGALLVAGILGAAVVVGLLQPLASWATRAPGPVQVQVLALVPAVLVTPAVLALTWRVLRAAHRWQSEMFWTGSWSSPGHPDPVPAGVAARWRYVRARAEFRQAAGGMVAGVARRLADPGPPPADGPSRARS